MSIRYDEKFVLRPRTEHEYTQDEILELSKCSADIYEFIKHVKIVHPDKGKITYEPYDYQRELLELIDNNRYIIGMWCRQCGKCEKHNTKIKIRNKHTGKEEEIQIGDFFKKIASKMDQI